MRNLAFAVATLHFHGLSSVDHRAQRDDGRVDAGKRYRRIACVGTNGHILRFFDNASWNAADVANALKAAS